jgi:uncharacterized membrane protein YidH (DUF202 family)
MNCSRSNVGVGLAVLVAGVALFFLPFTGTVSSLNLGVSLYLLGMFVAGVGVGILANTSTIYRLEMKLEQERP